ncbi:MAG: DNA recombination protein RmuC [Clostridia bacterium]|nr:DNA recombination protein RmuC [Clostridia bacterium]
MTTLIIISIALSCLCLILLLVLLKREKSSGSDPKIKEKIDGLSASTEYTRQSVSALSSSTEYRLNFLQSSLNEQLRFISDNNQRTLEEIRRTVDEKLSSTLDNRLGETYNAIQTRLDAVTKSVGEVHSLAESVSDIKKVFTNVKLRGTWGETQLNALLSQMLAPNQFEASVKLNPYADSMVDFAVLLPDKNGERVYLPIDSKFPIEEYYRLIDAAKNADKLAEEQAVKNLVRAVKHQADSIAAKYILPPRTTDFAIMYLPVESLYAEVLKLPDLGEHLNKRRVVVCGPTNLSALLSTLQTGFKVSAIESRSQELWQLLAAFKREFTKFAETLEKTQKKLQEAQTSIESAAGKTRAIAKKLKGVDLGDDEQISLEGFLPEEE